MVRTVTFALAIVFCAVSAASAAVEKRIVGGQHAQQSDIPFIVYIAAEAPDYKRFCAGSLLDSTTVLTAAHCIDKAISVKAGTVDLEKGGVVAGISSRKKHPKYSEKGVGDGTYANNDIGILKLSTPIMEGQTIGYASLPGNGTDPVINSTATVAGWGSQLAPFVTVIGDGGTTLLRKVDIPVRARLDCSSLDPDVGSRDTIVCAGGNGTNPCVADSGGPLIDQKTGQLIAVTSWVIRDKNLNFCDQAPSVFTRVGSYMDFITEYLGGHS